MSSLLKKIFQNHSTRVLVLLFAALLILIGYFLTHSYYVQLNIHKNKILSRLDAVAKTAATQINGNQLDYLHQAYPNEDDIETNYQDRVYQLLHEKLSTIKKTNNLSSSIYTLSFDTTSQSFFFGVSSQPQPFFRHNYEHYPKELKTHYELGGKIDVYEDKNGHWLSAFAPIKNSEGKVIAVVQADNRFDEFLEEARREIFVNIGISALFTIILIFFLGRTMSSILVKEDQLTARLIQSKLALEEKSQETLDSILYAKKIQEAILPVISTIKESLPDSFVFHIPRNIVSGDFYWFKKLRGKIFIASVDCTGHGVPGAFMSMIGSVLLDDIISKKKVDEPDEILRLLHKSVVKALKQASKERASRDGMDIALCVIDEEMTTLNFAGAFRPLIQVRDHSLLRIKSDSAPIGGVFGEAPNFTNHKVQLQKGDTFYIYSDGYADQFGGVSNKKYMTRRFREFLLKISPLPMEEQKEKLYKEFQDWKGEAEQVDDVLVIGFKL